MAHPITPPPMITVSALIGILIPHPRDTHFFMTGI
jgi:hypothetical protein